MTIGKSEFGWENSVNETKSDGEREEIFDNIIITYYTRFPPKYNNGVVILFLKTIFS